MSIFKANGSVSCTILLVFLASIFVGSEILAQDKKEAGSGKKKDETTLATVKGRLVQHENKKFKINFDELKPSFDQRVELPSEPLPKNWKELTEEQRQKWVKDFDASEKGKALAAARKKTLEEAESFKITAEENGNFVIYDVPAGTYGIRGRMEKVIDEQNYVFEIFGQVVVSEKAEEVLLDPISVLGTRLIKRGEPVPEFKFATFDGKKSITDKMLGARPVIISFWALESPPSLEFAKTIQETYKSLQTSHKLHLVSVCIGSDRKKALEHVQEKQILGWHGYVKDSNQNVLDEFGVRVIPAIFLVDAKGKIMMTHGDFKFAFLNPKNELKKLVSDAIEGKNIPTPVVKKEPAEDEKSGEATDEQNAEEQDSDAGSGLKQ